MQGGDILNKVIKKHYAGSFYIATFILSFLLLTLHFVFKSVGNYSVSFTQLAPAMAAILIAFFSKDKAILHSIKDGFLMKSGDIRFLIAAIGIPTTCIVISSLVMSLLEFEYISWTGDIQFYMLNIAAMLVGCFAEEIGWRGFLLPKLQEKYTPFVSGIIVGALWGIWHLNFISGILGFILYTITIIEMSVLMTWLYNKTNRNLFLMGIWHSTFNLLSHIFLWERFNIYLLIVESIVFGALCFFIIISRNKDFFKFTDKKAIVNSL